MATRTKTRDLWGDVDYELAQACIELGQARIAVTCKDSNENRARLADARAAVDALLDMRIDLGANDCRE